MEQCPECGGPLEKIYPAIFSGPVWLGCRPCRKFVRETKEIGRHRPSTDSRQSLYPEGSEDLKEILKE